MWRVGWPAILLVAVVMWLLSDSLVALTMGTLLVPVQWMKLTANQRRQVLGRSWS